MRYELKYLDEVLSVDQCHQIVRNHPSSFRKSYPDRRINNIYLDSLLGQAFLQNVNGVSKRIKYRIRWYGHSWMKISGASLEFKMKQNHLGRKNRIELPDFNPAELTRVIEENKVHWQLEEGIYPISTNSYLRSYYEDFTGRFRITIDSDLKFGRYLGDNKVPEMPFGATIIELKYSKGLKAESDFVQQHLPWRRTKFSKYVEGLSSVLK